MHVIDNMGIESKDTNILVTTQHSVLISDVANAVIDNKSIDWIQQRYPVTVNEVFEVIDFYADKFDDFDDQSIDLQNLGSDTDVELECKSISDGMFFNILSYGRQFFPSENRFPWLFKFGLHTILIEVFTDLSNGNTNFESSQLHTVIYEAIKDSISKLTPEEILENLNDDLVNYEVKI